MSLNIVTERHGWILHRCAEEIAKRIPNVTVNGDRHAADWNYYIPAYAFIGPGDRGPAIGLWTHPTPERMDAFIPRYRAHVSMNVRVAAELHARGASPVQVIRPGASAEPRRLTFGVCGRTYKDGRKGERLVSEMVRAGHSVVAWGAGWPCRVIGDDLDSLPAFYGAIDYLIVTSTQEGGPMPVVDAMAYGVPVIAPNVGWCWEFPVIHYERGDWSSLRAVLHGLTSPPTWQEWADKHAALFRQLGVIS